jgi:GT2 family glycosyltransferase
MSINSASSGELIISIVTYHPDLAEFRRTLKSLKAAIDYLQQYRCHDVHVMVVDNSVDKHVALQLSQLLQEFLPEISALICSPANTGYGAGHLLATSNCRGCWYLAMNADVEMDVDALAAALVFLEHPDNQGVGLISPHCESGDGQRAYLCKRYPSVLDLALRGFAPAFLRKQFQTRLEHYEYRHCTEHQSVNSIRIVSGCFMFFRGQAWHDSGGFSVDYFLYFEDFDLCMRLSKMWDIAYVPQVRIIHHGGHAARKGLKHIFLFVRSARRFFATHGWRLI